MKSTNHIALTVLRREDEEEEKNSQERWKRKSLIRTRNKTKYRLELRKCIKQIIKLFIFSLNYVSKVS